MNSIANKEEIAEHAHVEALPNSVKKDGGLVLTVDGEGAENLKLAKDGHTVLLPQPTDDPEDPLNWSSTRKHIILCTVAFGALCSDFTSAAGTATLFVQGLEWDITPNHVNQSGSLNILMMGIGGLIWVPMSSFWGRAPVLFWTTVIGTLFGIGAAVSKDFSTFYAMRALTGLFITAAQTISIAFIKDLFFFHERARKIGLWASLYISSPYLGPCLANFIIAKTGHWRDVFWLCVGVCCLQLCFILCSIDETWYNRNLTTTEMARKDKGLFGRLTRVIGIWQLKHHKIYFFSVKEAYDRFIRALLKPVVLLVLLSYLCIFAWAIGINITTTILFATPEEYGGYGFSNLSIGYLYFTPIVGIALGEIFGHFFNDFLAHRYISRHGGVFASEVRLVTIYVSSFFMIPGLILLGQALRHHLSVGAVVMGWGMYSFGVMTASVAVTAYLLDSYPTVPAELAGWTNFSRVIAGFSVGYFQSPWGEKIGYDKSFGIQAAVVGVSLSFIIVAHVFGRHLRSKGLID